MDSVSQADRRPDASELDLHVIADNYGAHKHPKVKAWLARHPRFHIHFIPTSSSWLNLVERFLRELTESAFDGCVLFRRRSDRGDRSLHRRSQPAPETVGMDRVRRHDHGQSRPGPYQPRYDKISVSHYTSTESAGWLRRFAPLK